MDPNHLSLATIIALGFSLLLLILLSALFSASETAYTTITNFKYETHYKKKKKNWVFKINNKLLNNFSMTLSTILISNTLVNVAASTLSTLFFTSVILNYSNASNAEAIGTGLATGIVTFLILIFGEFLPKAFARNHSLWFIKIFGVVIYVLYYLFFPISWILNKVIKPEKKNSVTEQEIDTLIDIVSNEGVLENSEASLVSNSLRFDETKVASVMLKKDQIVYVNADDSKQTILTVFNEHPYSRLPLKKGSNFIGYIDVKTFISLINKRSASFNVNDIAKPILKVSQYQSLDSVFREMQVNQIHIALVKKNLNSQQILGMVTMEDILEFLVGNIQDEHDITLPVTEINDFTWKVAADYSANKFIKEEIKLPIQIDSALNIKEWLKMEFDVERFSDKDKFQNDFFSVVARTTNHKLFFIFEKKDITIF